MPALGLVGVGGGISCAVAVDPLAVVFISVGGTAVERLAAAG